MQGITDVGYPKRDRKVARHGKLFWLLKCSKRATFEKMLKFAQERNTYESRVVRGSGMPNEFSYLKAVGMDSIGQMIPLSIRLG